MSKYGRMDNQWDSVLRSKKAFGTVDHITFFNKLH